VIDVLLYYKESLKKNLDKFRQEIKATKESTDISLNIDDFLCLEAPLHVP